MSTEETGPELDGPSLDRLAGMAALAPSRWRKLPAEIEAWQVRLANAGAVAAWCGGEFRPGGGTNGLHALTVRTLEGPLDAHMGDWVVKGGNGEFWPVREDIFPALYEPADGTLAPQETVTVARALLACALRDAIRMTQADSTNGDPEAPDLLAEYEEALAGLIRGTVLSVPDLDRLREVLQQPPEPGPSLPDGEASGARIRRAREAAGLTQTALAAALGVTQTAVSYWEGGKRDPGVADLLRIAEALKVHPASLLPVPEPEGAPQSPLAPGGRFEEIAFFGHLDHIGYVTEAVDHGGNAVYRIDLPGKIWGGNPLDEIEYAASAKFSRKPVTEESVRAQWEAERARAERWRQQQADWDRQQAQPALPAGADACLCGPDEECDECEPGGRLL